MQLKDLIRSARVSANDMQLIVFSDDVDLIRWANEAQAEAAIRGRLLFEGINPRMCEIAVDAGTQVYKLDPLWHQITLATLVLDSNTNCKKDLPLRTRDDITLEKPDWRTNTDREPFALVLDDKVATIAGLLTGPGTLYLEGYRLPVQMESIDAVPEISEQHHVYLPHWMLHRMYEVPDSEIFNQDKSEKALTKFTAYFGPRPDSDRRAGATADQVHHSRAWWI